MRTWLRLSYIHTWNYGVKGSQEVPLVGISEYGNGKQKILIAYKT